ncbi:MAG TPA: ferritin-like domain-containing protein [Abditibacterium sp.]|jgi:hypothetical protein
MSQQQDQLTLSRRALLRCAAWGGAATSLVALAAPARAQTAPAATPAPAAPPAAAAPPAISASDLEIAGFALGLERLEASFYNQIVSAHNTRAFLDNRLIEVAREIAANEASHVTALESLISGAGGTLPAAVTYRFPANVFISPVAFAWFGHTLEDIGIGAYLGAVGQIKSGDIRRAAASIYGAETRHATILRLLGGFPVAPRYFESPLSVPQVQGLIAPYLAA